MAFECPSYSKNYSVRVSGKLINQLAAQGATLIVYLLSDTRGYEGELASPIYFLAPLPDGNWREVAAVGLNDSVREWGPGRIWGNDRLVAYAEGRRSLLSDPGAIIEGVIYVVT